MKITDERRQAMRASEIISDSRGLTLVELMIVVVLSMLLMSAVYMTYQIQKGTSDIQHLVATVQQDLRAVLDIMTQDIRHAGCDPTLQTTAGIIHSQTGPLRISFSMDLNEDGDTADLSPDEQVSYSLNGTTLMRNGIELAQNVTTMGFTFYDGDNAVITPTDSGGSALTAAEAKSVRDVEVVIGIRSGKIDPDTGEHISRSMVRRVKMRNQGI